MISRLFLSILFIFFSRSCLLAAIDNGRPAIQGQFPFFVQITLIYADGSSRKANDICGGAILNDKWIVSAAHCFSPLNVDKRARGTNKTNFAPLAGKKLVNVTTIVVNSGTTESLQTGRWGEIEVSEENQQKIDPRTALFKHPEYFSHISVYTEYDLALIRLPTPLKFSNYTQAIDYVPLGEATSDCRVAGFGADQTSTGVSPTLKYMETGPIELPSQEKGNWSFFHAEMTRRKCPGSLYHPEQFLCTNALDATICAGDSGGPLVCRNDDNGEDFLLGVLSHGTQQKNRDSPCLLEGSKMAFTSLWHFDEWIQKTISTVDDAESHSQRLDGNGKFTLIGLSILTLIFYSTTREI